jgi:hypothetical protein
MIPRFTHRLRCAVRHTYKVVATADAFCKSMLDTETLPEDIISISKEMLDDRYQDLTKQRCQGANVHFANYRDCVKKRLQAILNPEHPENCPPEFVMPAGMTDLAVPVHDLIVLLIKMV